MEAAPASKTRPARALLRRLRPYTRPHRRYVVYVFAGLLLGLPLAWLQPLLVQRLFDDVVPSGDMAAFGGLCLWFGLLVFGQALFALGRGVATTLYHHRVSHRLRLDLLRSFQSMEPGAVVSKGTGAWAARLADDVHQLGGVLGDQFAAAVSAVLQAAVAAAIIFVREPLMAGVAVGGALLLLGVHVLSAKPLRRRSEATRAANEKLTEGLYQSVTGTLTVRANAAEPREARRFATHLGTALRTSIRQHLFGLFAGHPSVLLGGLFPTGLLLLGGYRIAEGRMTTGALFAVFGLLGQLFDGALRLGAMQPAFQNSLAALDRIVDVLDTAEARPQPSGSLNPTTLRGEVAFENMTFGYAKDDGSPGPIVLRDVSFRVPAGSTVALVGPSGAGKSTLVSLLLRFHEPRSGRILLDGVPLADYDAIELRKRIGFVTQDVFLFDRTARENLLLGRPDASESLMRAAAAAAAADEFLTALPEGYDTRLGERGVKLSAGQRQRLALAREILRDPRILILDEATAWLDAESERSVQQALARLLPGRTAFVIAHRLSTIRGADFIVVLEDGRVAEQGTHDELLAAGGRYASLARLQFLGGEA